MPSAVKKGSTTQDNGTVGKRAEARKAREEAEKMAREAQIESGDLIVTRTHEFSATSKDTASSATIAKIINEYQKSPKPLVFGDVAAKYGSKYPEDLIACMYSLEALGMVRRFGSRAKEGDKRPRQAFLWVAE